MSKQHFELPPPTSEAMTEMLDVHRQVAGALAGNVESSRLEQGDPNIQATWESIQALYVAVEPSSDSATNEVWRTVNGALAIPFLWSHGDTLADSCFRHASKLEQWSLIWRAHSALHLGGRSQFDKWYSEVRVQKPPTHDSKTAVMRILTGTKIELYEETYGGATTLIEPSLEEYYAWKWQEFGEQLSNLVAQDPSAEVWAQRQWLDLAWNLCTYPKYSETYVELLGLREWFGNAYPKIFTKWRPQIYNNEITSEITDENMPSVTRKLALLSVGRGVEAEIAAARLGELFDTKVRKTRMDTVQLREVFNSFFTPAELRFIENVEGRMPTVLRLPTVAAYYTRVAQYSSITQHLNDDHRVMYHIARGEKADALKQNQRLFEQAPHDPNIAARAVYDALQLVKYLRRQD